ncbi:hypothetical protein QYM36_000767 [Artemia franciscana]|uniref:Uncharacterized protein n=1 Tax=Artemia franciscana TaxID=6661 RepID=A0AA88IMC8_ARTSF|nr:hypothetical protein QYM36_000767 [Artemia franciscana]
MTPSSPWKRGTIVKVCLQPRSYTIATDDGSMLQRNRVRLSHRNSDEAIHSKQDYQNQQTKPVPDRGGVTQTRSGRTIIKPTRLNLQRQ